MNTIASMAAVLLLSAGSAPLTRWLGLLAIGRP